MLSHRHRFHAFFQACRSRLFTRETFNAAMQFQNRKYSRFSYRASNFYSNLVSVLRKMSGYRRNRKSSEVTVIPLTEHLLDDIACQYKVIVKNSLRYSDIPLENTSVDIQRPQLKTLDADVFLGCIHLFSNDHAQIQCWLQKIPGIEKKIQKLLQADGLLCQYCFTGLWWLGARDKTLLVWLQADGFNQLDEAA